MLDGEIEAEEKANLFDICTTPSPISIFVRVCSCGRVKRNTTLESGMFNFNDSMVLSLPLLIHFRELLSRGTALHNIVLSWAASLKCLFDISLTPRTITKVKQAYIAFEAMSEHGDDSVCLLCKGSPSTLIFDGNAKLVFKISGLLLLLWWWSDDSHCDFMI